MARRSRSSELSCPHQRKSVCWPDQVEVARRRPKNNKLCDYCSMSGISQSALMHQRSHGAETVLGRSLDSAAFMRSRDGIAPAAQQEEEEDAQPEDSRTQLDRSPEPQDTDLLFLDAFIGDPLVRSLVQVQERLEHPPVHATPVCSSIVETVQQISRALEPSRNPESRELLLLLRGKQLRTLLETHDAVVAARLANGERELEESQKPENERQKPRPLLRTMPSNDDRPAEAVRIVGLRRKPDEPLGLTIQVDENGNLIIARILGGSTAASQGLLRPGEVILEVNGKQVRNPDELQIAISDAKENLTLKLAPGISADGSKPIKSTCYMRALFDYEPTEDSLLPCREIGLPFQKGDILQIVDQADPNWWQARRIEGNSLGPPGLVPSLELEERRKAFVPPEADFVHKISICGTRISKKKKRKMYQSKSNGEFDGAELLLYEEVARMPPFRRKTLALVGPRGVGRRTLKNRLINSDPEKFGTIVPFTSRPPRVLEENGKSYWFTERDSMETDIREHRYLEHGEHGGHLYGTKLDSVRELIRAGKMCVLDCSPAALKILHNSTEFMPYVIFIAAPGMEQLKSLYDLGRSTGASNRNLTFDRQSSIRYSSRRARTLESLASLYEEDDLKSTVEESAALQRAYEKYIDLVIVNEDFDHTFRQVVAALDALASEDQWVPVNWIY
ncbi:MAGUK p55 subfamily member 6 isoform X2 [Nasonia vitripennis]|uniref:MAGUK p55 subfamily member 6 n=2 Tax=Nasonia vitripennis TaxID=7425 RepID=A0A7M7H380_NASVI|nr:MAGUK p55 subfamily member 6 isoform X2 [Nasonia vitripennis]